jgi:hypothetical protein
VHAEMVDGYAKRHMDASQDNVGGLSLGTGHILFDRYFVSDASLFNTQPLSFTIIVFSPSGSPLVLSSFILV